MTSSTTSSAQTASTMEAVRLEGPCGTSEMRVSRVPVPELKPGFVLVRVKAFGVNESEVTSRQGGSGPDFSFPRILGIEGAGIVEKTNPGSAFAPGQPVLAMMGGMGREYDGSYAQYMCVRESALIPLDPALVARTTWDVIGAMGEMTQTAYGTLHEGCGLKKGDVVLVHGGTSNVGLMCIVLAKWLGAQVIATSRSAARLDLLTRYGADHALVDDDTLRPTIARLYPQGIDGVAEFVGIDALLKDTALLRQGGKACYTGSLDGVWSIGNFSPFAIKQGAYITSYAGEARDFPSSVADDVLKAVIDGDITLPVAQVYHGLAEVGRAQDAVEHHTHPGKHVVVLDD